MPAASFPPVGSRAISSVFCFARRSRCVHWEFSVLLLQHLLLRLLLLQNFSGVAAQLRLVRAILTFFLASFDRKLLPFLLVDHAVCVKLGEPGTSTGLLSIRWLRRSLHIHLRCKIGGIVTLHLLNILLLLTLEFPISLFEAELVDSTWNFFVHCLRPQLLSRCWLVVGHEVRRETVPAIFEHLLLQFPHSCFFRRWIHFIESFRMAQACKLLLSPILI